MRDVGCAVHSNILGHYAAGSWRSNNPEYVPYGDRKKKVEYTEEQDRPYIWHEVVEPIVAVTYDKTSGGESWLKLWVLVEGELKWLNFSAKVMPAGWEPNIR